MNNILNCIQLSLNHLDSLIRFSLIQCLTEAENNLKAILESTLNFLCDDLVCFTKMGPSFRVTYNHPGDIDIFKMLSRNLSSKGSKWMSRAILGGNFNVLIFFSEHHGHQMKVDWCYNNIYIIIVIPTF